MHHWISKCFCSVCYTCCGVLFATHAVVSCLLHMLWCPVCYTCCGVLFATHVVGQVYYGCIFCSPFPFRVCCVYVRLWCACVCMCMRVCVQIKLGFVGGDGVCVCVCVCVWGWRECEGRQGGLLKAGVGVKEYYYWLLTWCNCYFYCPA